MKKNNPLIVRVNDDLKIEFKVAILRRRVTMQSLFISFISEFVTYDKGEKNPLMDKIVKRSYES
jgi:hypothetical protein